MNYQFMSSLWVSWQHRSPLSHRALRDDPDRMYDNTDSLLLSECGGFFRILKTIQPIDKSCMLSLFVCLFWFNY